MLMLLTTTLLGSVRTRTNDLTSIRTRTNDLPATTVFSAGLANISCFRIPSIVRTPASALVAFAEARHGSCGDGNVYEIAYRRSTDGGATWSDVGFAVGNSSFRVGNPTAVATVAGDIVLVYVTHNHGKTGDPGSGTGIVTSADGGLTWSAPRDVSTGFGVASGALPGPGTALQLAGPVVPAGRLLVVSHLGAYQKDYVSYSDDLGGTWTTVDHPFPSMDEAQLAQLPNGSVYLNMRHRDSPSKGRGVALSDDGGETWGPIRYDAALISPVCQASVATIGRTVYFSNPDSTSARANITIKASDDSAATWERQLLVEAAASAGYSCLVQGGVSSTRGGILFEAVGTTIAYAEFPLEW